MGLGGLFGGGGQTNTSKNVEADYAAVDAANKANAVVAQQASDKTAADTAALITAQNLASANNKATTVAKVQQSFNDASGSAGQNAAALGILDFIKTGPQGLKNNDAKSGRLTLLGN